MVVAQAETSNASDVIPASLLVPGCMFDATSNEATSPKHPDQLQGWPNDCRS